MSAEPRRDRSAPHTLYKTLLGASGAEALPNVDREYWATEEILREVTPEVIAEQLATGRLPVEVALMYEVPILHFRRWMRENISEDLLEDIRSAAAESLQVKAMLTLSAELKNPAEASQAKALSERFAKISEALAPKDWNPARVEVPGDLPSIAINFNGMGMSISATHPHSHIPTHPEERLAPAIEHDINAEAPELVTSNEALGEGRHSSALSTPLPHDGPDQRTSPAGYDFWPPRQPSRAPTTEDILEGADPFQKVQNHRPMSEGM